MGIFKGNFYSQSLNITTTLNIIFPDESNDVTPVIKDKVRVLYLLHGLAANSDEWIRFSKIEYYAKKYNFIVIMPEVNRSFYSNMEYGWNYFDYVSKELPSICQRWFNIPTDRNSTFIAGESMGGYGALKTALKCPEQYAAVASLSGVVDYKAFIDRVFKGEFLDMKKSELIAILGNVCQVKNDDDLFYLLDGSDKIKPRVIQICGLEDFLYKDNLKFKKKIEALAYDYHYMEWNGDHEWPFWDVAIQRAIQFFLELDVEKTPIY